MTGNTFRLLNSFFPNTYEIEFDLSILELIQLILFSSTSCVSFNKMHLKIFRLFTFVTWIIRENFSSIKFSCSILIVFEILLRENYIFGIFVRDCVKLLKILFTTILYLALYVNFKSEKRQCVGRKQF